MTVARREAGAGGAVLRTLVIGRSPSADVVIADASVAPHHAEIVITDDGRYHLTDCATEGGTWRQGTGEGRAHWHPVRQAFVDPAEPLRLGDHLCSVAELLRRAGEGPRAEGPGVAAAGGDGAPGPSQRIRGLVERDPATGDIVRRRP